jgi:dTDP-4-dehydrorhamnose reductase
MDEAIQRRHVLVTGGTGLLGVSWSVNAPTSWRAVLGAHQRVIVSNTAALEPVDLESVDAIKRAIEKTSATLVVHAAAMTNVDACDSDPKSAHHVNVELSANVARACAAQGVRLVHISTDHLFTDDAPFADELRPVAPLNVYARTKADGEAAVLDSCPDALVVRTNFYAWGPSYRRSFSDWILEALRERRSVTLFDDVFYTPILAESLIAAVHDLVDSSESGIFNVVGDERLSKLDFGRRLAAQFNLDAETLQAGRMSSRLDLVQRPREMSLSNAKATRALRRRIGGVDEHLVRLFEQERSGVAAKVQSL